MSAPPRINVLGEILAWLMTYSMIPLASTAGATDTSVIQTS